METLLYEISFSFSLIYLLPLLLLALFLFYPRLYVRLYPGSKKGREVPARSLRFVKIVSLLLSALVVFITLLSAVALVKDYKATAGAYQEGNYLSTEGSVTNFHPADPQNSDKALRRESFTLGGVSFSYSPASVAAGYHTPRELGGVIQGDGQRLRIGYVPLAGGENRIVAIWQLD